MFVQCRKEWKTLSLYKPCLFAFVFLWICDGIVFLVEGESKMLKSLGTSIPSWIRKLSRIEEWGSLNRKRKKICKRVFFLLLLGSKVVLRADWLKEWGKEGKTEKKNKRHEQLFFFFLFFSSLFLYSGWSICGLLKIWGMKHFMFWINRSKRSL